MFVVKQADLIEQLLIGHGEAHAVDIFEGEKHDRPLVLPRFTQRSMLGDFQALEQVLTVFPNVKEVSQHAHTHGLPEPAGAGNQRDLRNILQQLRDQPGLIHIIISLFPDLGEVRDPYGNL